MSLPRAFCIQTNNIVDIAAARQIYFSKPEPRQDLDFLCASAVCRNGSIKPIVLGVNYNKIPGVDQYVQQPHFRTKPKHQHHQDCPYVEYQTAVKEYDQENQLSPAISGIKKSSLVEIFAPVAVTENDDVDTVDIEILEGTKQIKDKKRRIEAIKDLLKKIPNRTRRLHEAAQCFLGEGVRIFV